MNPTNLSIALCTNKTISNRARRLFFGAFLPLLLLAFPGRGDAAVAVADQNTARDALLAGVTNIAVVGAPGRVAVFDPPGAAAGQGGFAVTRDNEYDVAIAAAFWGGGRIVALPHPGYLDFSSHAATSDTARLYTNSIGWAANSGKKNIGIVTNRSEARSWLAAQGYTNVTERHDWENGLTNAGLVVIELAQPTPAQSTALATFVQNGGGLLTGGVGWGYQQVGFDLKTMTGNALLRQAGLAWANGFCEVNPVQRATALGNASAALTFAQGVWGGTTTGTVAQKLEAGRAAMAVLDALPAGHALLTSINTAFGTRASTVSATPAAPVSDPLDKAVLTWEAGRLAATPAASVTAHSTAQAVYGSIPAGADRSMRTVPIDTNKNRWLSTGMYAEPGALVTMTFPASLVGKGFFVQLGGHVDNITGREQWKRIPFGIVRRFPIDSASIKVASAFGGAIYIDVGNAGRPNLGSVNITTSGAIQAPYFVLGQTTNAAWNGGIKNYPAPYAEMACDGVIFSVPSSWIRNLSDPIALMTFWRDVVARQDWVAAHETMRTNPERINIDVQISVGLLHAGYPQQGPTDYNTVVVNGTTQGVCMTLEQLRARGEWGWFHELGHEMQGRPDDSWNHYTFDGDVEVTVNIFANAAQELGAPKISPAGWGWANYPDQVMQRAISTVNNAGQPNFDSKDGYPFYFQLADGPKGWQAYRDVMTIYNANHAVDRAAGLSNQQKKDLWLQRWSQASGFNMVQYMVNHWKLEVSPQAIQAVNAMTTSGGQPLPSWMPLASSLRETTTRTGVPTTLNLGGAGMSLDGTATLVSVTAPANGTLTDDGGGMYTYRSNAHFTGTDTFSTTYRSSAGNTQAFTTTISVHDGLSSYWRMDEGSGTSLADSGFAKATGTTQGSPTWGTGRFGSGLQFDGVDDHVTFTGNSPSLGGTTDFSLVAWIRTTASGIIIQQRQGVHGQYNFLVDENGTLRFWIYNSGFQFDFSTTQTVNDGQWHLVMAQRQGGDGRIYIDGQLAATATGPLKALDPLQPVTIGYDRRDNQRFFTGTIDEVRIHNYIIDDSDNDGISDAREQAGQDAAGNPTGSGPTNPLLHDSDGDGFDDNIETALGSNPNSSASTPCGSAITVSTSSDVSNRNYMTGNLSLREVAEVLSLCGTAGPFTVRFAPALNGATINLGSNLGFNSKSVRFDTTGLAGGITIGATAGALASATVSKAGPGHLTMTAASTYGGGTTVAAGSLMANNTAGSATGTGAVSVESGGTLGGTGTVSGAVVVKAGGAIAPGASTGTLSAGGNVTIQGTYRCEIDGAAADRLVVAGTLDISGATLNCSVGTGGATQPFYLIATYGTLSGTQFATVSNLPSGYMVDYAFSSGGSSNHIALVNGAGLYQQWINLAYPGQTNPATVGFSADPNRDGLPNGIAFVTATSPSALPTADPFTATRNATHIVFTFRRSDSAVLLAPYVEFGSNLTGWTRAVNGAGGVTVQVEDNFYGTDSRGVGIDRVTVSIPTSGLTPRVFVRLSADSS